MNLINVSGVGSIDGMPKFGGVSATRSPSILERLGANTDRLLEKGFNKWGVGKYYYNIEKMQKFEGDRFFNDNTPLSIN
jgi:hypothetical protein